MGGPRPDWWHLTALVTGPTAEEIGARTDARDELQWEAGNDDRSALVSVRYLAQSATMQGVLIQGRAALRRAFGDTANTIEPTALLREEDGAVYDPDDL
ncbi:Uncharacterised protein (plasmid) [Tsukamurella tyrosinosolvens]|uniref:Uncharacterized protein n=1 Tax=Tsukamurella tyrosinosolvens TaxID=57704 RepID=A0A1H4V452_TSUTY|nr:hypothetical protein [Tsukamurella tyrosinosolvens]KXO91064.1 hypothetical protein AXK58_21780 [Tsukamurella tyrosinosolvens]SEC75408.1 hypothetical protein SAMN04489793_3125 [Tsukamurella tyrosinosolvens]VEH90714.1 Uncharacterised protein [Tsukamurella tyrosinosolvens]